MIYITGASPLSFVLLWLTAPLQDSSTPTLTVVTSSSAQLDSIVARRTTLRLSSSITVRSSLVSSELLLIDRPAGLYFDMSESLRVNYAHLWLSLLSPSSPSVELDRRKYAYLAGNIDESLYPIFQAAITGRASLETSVGADGGKPGSMMELGDLTREETREIRRAVVQEGLMTSIFDLLRRVPRRILMVLKVK